MRPRAPIPSPGALCVVALCAVALWPVGLWLVDGASAVAFPYPLDYGEGPLLDQALRLASGENIYRPLTAEPWTVSNYPPVYPAVLAGAAALAGPSFAFGRSISLLSALAVALCIGLVVRRLADDSGSAVAAGLVFLAMPYVAFWSRLQRVDFLGLALTWGAVAWLVRGGEPGGRPAAEPESPSLAPAVLLLVAAAFTRQTFALAMPGALAAWMVARGEGRRALRLLGGCAALGLVLATVLQWRTGGFFDHVVTANWNPWRMDLLVDHAREVSLLLAVPLVATAGAASRPRLGGPVRVFVLAYFVLSLVSAVTIAKIGSNVNYLLELCAAGALGTGCLLACWPTDRREDLVRRAVLSALLAVQLVAWVPDTRHEAFAQMHRASADEAARLLQLLDDVAGPVVTDEWIGLLPLAGERVRLQPFERTQLAASGAWDPAPVVRWLRAGGADRVLLFRPEGLPGLWTSRWSPEMRRALEEAYVVEGRIGSTDVLVPRRDAAREGS